MASTFRIKPRPKLKQLTPVAAQQIRIKVKPKPIKTAEQAERHRINMRERSREKSANKLKSCAANVSNLDKMARTYVVDMPNGKVEEIKGFNITGLGEPLGTTGVTATRWVNSGMLPAPFLNTSRGAVYSIEEVRSFVEIIGELQKDSKQYRKNHTEVRDRLFRDNARIRKGMA
jgi:hypothetical protein